MMIDSPADQVEVTYYTDPLCCWSWAMEPQWRRFRYEFNGSISWRYCMGGLLPSWKQFADPVQSINRPGQMGPLWMEASYISGMPLNDRVWINNPPASSYPGCIAVKCAEKQSTNYGDVYLRLLREAVMLKGKNIAQLDILIEVAHDLSITYSGFNIAKFKSDLESNTGVPDFRKDLDEIKLKNIQRFPTLLFRRKGYAPLLLQGYRPYVIWLDIMNKIAPGAPKNEIKDVNEYKKFYPDLLEREEKEISLNDHDKMKA